jgi:enolase
LKITRIQAREVLDSRGRPTVEADVTINDRARGRAIVPSGASTGSYEAVELRDRESRFGGFGVKGAVENISTRIAPVIAGRQFSSQSFLDAKLLELDGTPNKRVLGANAILAVSLAFARAAAAADNIPLHRYFSRLSRRRTSMPLPMINILSGGLHAARQIDFQDFLIVPHAARSITQALEWTYDIYQAALSRCAAHGYNRQLVADEGGLGPALPSNRAALELLSLAIKDAGFEAPEAVGIAIDVAATHFFDGTHYQLSSENRKLTPAEMVQYLVELSETFPVISIEDGMAEDDWSGWAELTRALRARVQLVGDDLFVTNCVRLEEGISRGVANAILIKMNQVGSVSETIAAVQTAAEAGYRTIISARSGETEDSSMSDLAVGCDGGQIKVGSITRSSRLSKYNQLLRIQEDEGVRHWNATGLFPFLAV